MSRSIGKVPHTFVNNGLALDPHLCEMEKGNGNQ
jgi:hypothetical protein